MIYLAWAIITCASIAGTCYLVMHDSPWWAFLVFLIAACTEIKSSTTKETK